MIVGIAAVARNGVIGDGQDIPWRIPQDWRRFRDLTTGQVLIMGRKTYDSIGRPLPGRTTFVVTRNKTWRRDNVRAVPFLDEAFTLAGDLAPATIFIAGGGEIYRAAWHRLEALEVTEVDLAPPGNVTFPPIEPHEWRQTAREDHDGFSFVSYRRVTQPELGRCCRLRVAGSVTPNATPRIGGRLANDPEEKNAGAVSGRQARRGISGHVLAGVRRLRERRSGGRVLD